LGGAIGAGPPGHFSGGRGRAALVTDGLAGEEEVFLSGVMQDMQARLNVTNLLDAGKVHEPTLGCLDAPV
jgi:hypothetical protein